MADVARGHGGDAGGDPPGGPYEPPRGHNVDGTRGPTTCKGMRDAWRANGKRPLYVDFDFKDLKTLRPIGKNGQHLISLVGSIVSDRDFPKHYRSWNQVPASFKGKVLPEVEQYFDLRRLYADPEKGPLVRPGVEALCKERYKDAKFRFKKFQFKLRDGYNVPGNLRDNPPHGVNKKKIWIPFVDFVTHPKNMSRAESNAYSRSKQKFSSRHGSKSYASRRAERFEEDKKYPSLIENWEEMHTDKDTREWRSQDARELHEQMVNLRARSPNISEEEILDEVLGTRNGYNRGRGRKMPNSITGAMPSSSSGKGKGKMHENQMISVDDFSAYMREIASANPGMVIPTFSRQIDEDDEEDDEEDGDDEDEVNVDDDDEEDEVNVDEDDE